MVFETGDPNYVGYSNGVLTLYTQYVSLITS